VRAALQIQTEFNLVLEIILERRERRREIRIADYGIDAQHYDSEDE
jgi:hypothetical protein